MTTRKNNRKTFSRQQELEIIRMLIIDWERSVKSVRSMDSESVTLRQYVDNPNSLDQVLVVLDPDEHQRLTKKSKGRILSSVEQTYKVQNLVW
jgi:hypothetical protein